MEEVNYSGEPAYTVHDEKQAKLLSEHASFRYFAPFLARDCTVSCAAKEVGCKVDTMFYRVRTFLKAGLLHVVRAEKRAGRSVKYYRSVHDTYFIPFSATPFADFEEEARSTLRAHEDVIARELARFVHALNRRGRRIFRGKDGEVSAHTAKSDTHTLNYDLLPQLPYSGDVAEGAPTELFSDTLHLTDEEAKALLSHLYRLRLDSKFEKAPSRRPYLLQLALVPLSS